MRIFKNNDLSLVAIELRHYKGQKKNDDDDDDLSEFKLGSNI